MNLQRRVINQMWRHQIHQPNCNAGARLHHLQRSWPNILKKTTNLCKWSREAWHNICIAVVRFKVLLALSQLVADSVSCWFTWLCTWAISRLAREAASWLIGFTGWACLVAFFFGWVWPACCMRSHTQSMVGELVNAVCSRGSALLCWLDEPNSIKQSGSPGW